MIKICVMCGKAFEVDDKDRNRNRRRFCGIDCAEQGAYQRKRVYAKSGKDRARDVKCAVCGKIFRTSYSQKVTCSSDCKHERANMLSRERGRALREAVRNGTMQAPERKKAKKVEPIHDFNRKAREMGMSYWQYDMYLRLQAMRKEGMKNG